MNNELRLALLISGGGTTAEAIIRACSMGKLTGITPVLVIASREGIAGIERVIKAGMEEKNVIILNPKNFESSLAFGDAIVRACLERDVNIIGQYGWLCKTPANVIVEFEGRMINQHPGPLDPGFQDFGGTGMYGKRVHAARLCFVKKTNKDFWTEATSQKVAIEYDGGAILNKKQVPILPDDTPETLANRILPVEHEVQIETLENFARGESKEIVREERLVRPGEEKILDECKTEAIKNYPKG